MKTLVALLATVASTLALAPAATAAAPVNDDFADAAAIEGEKGFAETNTAFATKEAGEPDHAGNPGGHSAWFTWTAPTDGTYVFSTGRSTFDTLLAVYTGSDVGALTEVGSNDDTIFGSWSEVAILAAEGTEYAIAVDGFGGKRGPATLAWWPGEANDLFAHPQAVTGAVGSATGENLNATTETGEPTPANSEGSVWFEWTAPETRLVKFRVAGNGFDTALGVYTGTSLDDLTTIATNADDLADRCCSHSFVGFDAVAGTVYRIAVGGEFGERGTFTLSWSPLILGTPGPDILVGTSGAEEIRGLGGNDVIRGLDGADVLVGGAGNDMLLGGSGNDLLLDLSGRDVLRGGSGSDLLRARDFAGRDRLVGGAGPDRCEADRGDSRLSC